jgi:hypothetical protein
MFFNPNFTFMIQLQNDNICDRLDFILRKTIIHDAQDRSQHENGQF